jgi:uncharacterized SAM-binding protein YcdF (DUF218 family)
LNGPSSEAVVVLGFRNRGHRANFVNRQRVRLGLLAREPGLGPSRLVLCGGAVGSPVPEAELMARYARGKLGYTGELSLETISRSTWENIENAIPLIEDADRIKIVSNFWHTPKARRYLNQLRPDLAQRLITARSQRPKTGRDPRRDPGR